MIIVILLSIISPVILFSNKNSYFVKSNEVLNRVASISVESTTAQTRLITWKSSWQGFLERPMFGWGSENFYQVFPELESIQQYA